MTFEGWFLWQIFGNFDFISFSFVDQPIIVIELRSMVGSFDISSSNLFLSTLFFKTNFSKAFDFNRRLVPLTFPPEIWFWAFYFSKPTLGSYSMVGSFDFSSRNLILRTLFLETNFSKAFNSIWWTVPLTFCRLFWIWIQNSIKRVGAYLRVKFNGRFLWQIYLFQDFGL